MTWVRPPSKLTAQCEEQDGGSSGGSDIANPWREPLLRQHEGTASCLTGMTFCLDGSLSRMRIHACVPSIFGAHAEISHAAEEAPYI
jgi:hypothetical protein